MFFEFFLRTCRYFKGTFWLSPRCSHAHAENYCRKRRCSVIHTNNAAARVGGAHFQRPISTSRASLAGRARRAVFLPLRTRHYVTHTRAIVQREVMEAPRARKTLAGNNVKRHKGNFALYALLFYDFLQLCRRSTFANEQSSS